MGSNLFKYLLGPLIRILVEVFIPSLRYLRQRKDPSYLRVVLTALLCIIIIPPLMFLFTTWGIDSFVYPYTWFGLDRLISNFREVFTPTVIPSLPETLSLRDLVIDNCLGGLVAFPISFIGCIVAYTICQLNDIAIHKRNYRFSPGRIMKYATLTSQSFLTLGIVMFTLTTMIPRFPGILAFFVFTQFLFGVAFICGMLALGINDFGKDKRQSRPDSGSLSLSNIQLKGDCTEICYTNSKREIDRLGESHHQFVMKAKRRLKTYLILLVVSMIMVVVATILSVSGHKFDLGLSIAGLFYIVLTFIFVGLVLTRTSSKLFIRYPVSADKSFLGEHRIILTDDNIYYISGDKTESYLWSKIIRIVKTGKYIILYYSQCVGFIVSSESVIEGDYPAFVSCVDEIAEKHDIPHFAHSSVDADEQ